MQEAPRKPKAAFQKRLASENTYATVLLAIFIETYGTEPTEHEPTPPLEWSPEAKRLELEQEFGVSLPDISVDRLNAAVQIVTTDLFYTNVDEFIKICNVLSGSRLSPHVFDPADADECAWGITEAMMLSPPEDDEPFTEEIRYYIGKVLDDEGIKSPPDVLRIGLWDSPADFGSFSTDDPALFAAEHQMQADEAADIENMLKMRLRDLLQQLNSLPIEGVEERDLLQSLGRGLMSA